MMSQQQFLSHKSLFNITLVAFFVNVVHGTHTKLSGNYRVRFNDIGDDVIPDTRTPFVILDTQRRYCHYGRAKNLPRQEPKGDHTYQGKRKRHIQGTKKKGCEAVVLIKEVVMFPSEEVLEGDKTPKKKRSTSTYVKKHAEKLQKLKRFFIKLPENDQHSRHVVHPDVGFQNPVAPVVRQKISQLVGYGITDTFEVKRCLQVFVEESVDHSPNRSNRSFYPLDKDIRNHVSAALQKHRISKIDIVNVEAKANDLAKDGAKVFFRSASEGNLLFIYQTQFQRHLISRYGNDICLLDATYRTTKYSLPLFLVVVKTNVGYSVACTFILQHEATMSISEAMNILREWNPSWKPKFWMVDFSEAEIIALETCFQDTLLVYLCDFHREQAWNRWLINRDHGLSHSKEEIMSLLRAIAYAHSEQDLQQALKALRDSVFYAESDKLKQWFERKWFPEYKRWVWLYRKQMGVVINTTNGIERQHSILKHAYLSRFRNNSLSGLIDVIVRNYLPDQQQRYIRSNAMSHESVGKSYSSDIPVFLHNRPAWFVEHCMQAVTDAEKVIDATDVRKSDTSGVFTVTSQNGERTVTLFGNERPDCSCFAFTRTHLPCKHIFAVLHAFNLPWKSLPKHFTEHPLFSLDETFLPDTASARDKSDHHVPVPRDESEAREEPIHVPVPRDETEAREEPTLVSHTLNPLDIARKCREELKSITEYTYLVEDAVLRKAHEQLVSIGIMLSNSAVSEENIHLLDTCAHKRHPSSSPTNNRDAVSRQTLFARPMREDQIGVSLESDGKDEEIGHTRLGRRRVRIKQPVPIIQGVAAATDVKNDLDIEGGTVAEPVLIDDTNSETDSLDSAFKESPFIPSPQGLDKDKQHTDSDGESIPPLLERLKRTRGNGEQVLFDEEALPSISSPIKENEKRERVSLTRTKLFSPTTTAVKKSQAALRRGCIDKPLGNVVAKSPIGEVLFDRDVAELLQDNSPVSNSIIDSYLSIMKNKANLASTKRVLYLTTLDVMNLLRKQGRFLIEDMSSYDIVAGVGFEEQRNHWILLVLFPTRKRYSYINPMGELSTDIDSYSRILRTCLATNGVSRSKFQPKPHPKQLALNACGLYVMKFAEQVMFGKRLSLKTDEVSPFRREVATCIVGESESLDNLCNMCGHEEDNDVGVIRWYDCDRCQRWFHQHCMSVRGECATEEDAVITYVCEVCRAAPPFREAQTATSEPSCGLATTRAPAPVAVPSRGSSESRGDGRETGQFEMCMHWKRVKLCRGCDALFENMNEPRNMVLRRKEWYSFYKHGIEYKNFGFRYYHISSQCLPKDFCVKDLAPVAPALKLKINDGHFNCWKRDGVDFSPVFK